MNEILVREFAKVLSSKTGASIGEKKLYRWLRENGYIKGGSTAPHQQQIEAGRFVVRHGHYKGKYSDFQTLTTLITEKGQQHLIAKFQESQGFSAEERQGVLL